MRKRRHLRDSESHYCRSGFPFLDLQASPFTYLHPRIILHPRERQDFHPLLKIPHLDSWRALRNDIGTQRDPLIRLEHLQN